MTGSAGRPTKPDATRLDPMIRRAAEEFLDQIAVTRRARAAAPTGPFRRSVLAVRLAEALEVLAAEEVNRVRLATNKPWRDVGAAFGISRQTAHTRFRVAGSELGT